jgi:hypothetical protein
MTEEITKNLSVRRDFLFRLFDREWEQTHEARALDGLRQFALMPVAAAGALAWHNFSEGRNVALEHARVLVIHFLHVCLAKHAGTLDRFLLRHSR